MTRPAIKPLTLDIMEEYARTETMIATPIFGNCLAGIGINDGDTLCIDLTRKPIPMKGPDAEKDIALVYDRHIGCAGVKIYLGALGGVQMVSTRPIFDGTMNGFAHAFPVEKIFGTVFACYDSADRLKWRRDISDRPSALCWEQTIRSGNVKRLEGGIRL